MPDMLKRGPLSWVIAVILALIVSGSVVVVAGDSSYDVDGMRLGFDVAPSKRGLTRLAVPPFGEVTATTHRTPLLLRVSIQRIYPNELSQVAEEIDDKDALVRKIEEEGRDAATRFVVRLLVLAMLGGMIGALLAPGKRSRNVVAAKVAAGALTGVLSVGAILGATYASYDVNAFKQPRYTGVLRAAPWATEAIAKRLADINAFRQELRVLARNVGDFYSKIDAWQPVQADTIKVLHVSDIHNNPAAVDLIGRVVRDFNVDLVVDTGDITDFGTPVETQLIEGIAGLPVPYVFVPGNHDSPQVLAFMGSARNVTVLNGRVATVKGVTIFGAPDPMSLTSDVTPADEEKLSAFRASLRRQLASMDQKPLVLAVHNPKAVRGLTGIVPVILVGHTHTQKLVVKDGAVLNNAGTTGAAGLRTFQHEEGLPYTLNLLHVDRSTKELIAVDTLSMMGAEQEFRLERNLIKGK